MLDYEASGGNGLKNHFQMFRLFEFSKSNDSVDFVGAGKSDPFCPCLVQKLTYERRGSLLLFTF